MTIAPTLAIVLALHGPFISGPSARVTPNVRFEIRYIADFSGDGTVEIFDNPNGTGTAIAAKVTGSQANDHTLAFEVNNTVLADTQYHFRITHHDPNGGVPDEVSQPPLAPVFTGAQAISDLLVQPDTHSALISWDANVIGFGEVAFGITTPGDLGTVTDDLNVTNHSIELTGLSPGTTYQFRVSNLHAIDGGALASATGSFTTLGAPVPEPSAFVAWAGLAAVGIVYRRALMRKSRREEPTRMNP